MSFVNRIEDGEVVSKPRWAHVEAKIAALKSQPAKGLTFYGGRDALMIIYFAPGHGFYVTARADDELGESVLVDESMGEELVIALVAGSDERLPRFMLVEEPIAMQAAKKFYDTGIRCNALSWANPIEIARRYDL
jgi:hypothetical protein